MSPGFSVEGSVQLDNSLTPTINLFSLDSNRKVRSKASSQGPFSGMKWQRITPLEKPYHQLRGTYRKSIE
jgi:hypothetical protein